MYRLLLVIVRTQQSEKHHLQALHMRKESAIETRLTFKKNLREVSMQAKSIYHCGYVRQRCWSNCAATSFLLRVYQNTKPFSLKVCLIEWRSRRHNRDKWRCCCNVAVLYEILLRATRCTTLFMDAAGTPGGCSPVWNLGLGFYQGYEVATPPSISFPRWSPILRPLRYFWSFLSQDMANQLQYFFFYVGRYGSCLSSFEQLLV